MYGFGDVDGPKFIHRERPEYPRLSVARKEQGTVVLMLHLAADGRLVRVEVVESAGERLDQAALASVWRSSYAPARKNGVALPCRALLPVRFLLRT